MTGKLLIRDSTPDDVAAITRIYGHHVLHGTATFEEEAPDARELARRRAATLDAGYPYLVAEQAGRVVGYAYAGSYRPRPAYRHTCENTVYVDPDCHRQGIGRALLAELIERCTAAGLRQMIAVIGGSDHDASIGLHQALGFRIAGGLTGVGFKFGTWVDSVILQRPLGPGNDTQPG